MRKKIIQKPSNSHMCRRGHKKKQKIPQEFFLKSILDANFIIIYNKLSKAYVHKLKLPSFVHLDKLFFHLSYFRPVIRVFGPAGQNHIQDFYVIIFFSRWKTGSKWNSTLFLNFSNYLYNC